MGDRVDVELSVLASQREEAEAVFTFEPDLVNKYDVNKYDGLIIFDFYGVNYGNLPCLVSLQEKGIAYDSNWCSGGDFSAGAEYGRFTPEGKLEVNTVYQDEINPRIGSLLELINSPDELRAFILAHHTNITPLPWDNQEEYGKLYRMHKLLQCA